MLCGNAKKEREARRRERGERVDGVHYGRVFVYVYVLQGDLFAMPHAIHLIYERIKPSLLLVTHAPLLPQIQAEGGEERRSHNDE